jgi:hypothetical protein
VSYPAPEEVYRSERYGDFAYTVPGLDAGATYIVRLHFDEIWWDEPGLRVFDVLIDGEPVLAGFDILAEAGAMYQALVKEFVATAGDGGEIRIEFRSVVENAKVNGIEIIPFRYRNAVSINCAGGKAWPFIADKYYSGGRRGGVEAHGVPRDFDVSGVEDKAPSRVYDMERFGDFSYTIPELKPGGSYLVRLHFSEYYWEHAGKRLFHVAINDSPVLTDFDIFAEAGAMYKAVVKKFPAVADDDGRIHIDFIGSVDNAQVNAIEVLW